MFASCFPFLYSAKAVKAPEVKQVQVEEDPRPVIEEVVLRRPFRVPDALLNIGNPAIKLAFKKFCKDNNLCVGCSYANPDSPMVLVFNGVLYECPHCDSDMESP
jgi:hypothetical protein